MSKTNGAVLLGRELKVTLDRERWEVFQQLAKQRGVTAHVLAGKVIEQWVQTMVQALAVEVGSRLSGIAR